MSNKKKANYSLDKKKPRKYIMGMKIKKAKMGRRPKPPQLKRSKSVTVKMTFTEHGSIKAAAKAAGLSLPALLMRPWRKDGGK